MMAARFLRCALPVLRHARSYAEAASVPTQMSFTFASPTQVFFKEASVRQVDVPTLTGAFGILPAHVPTLQVLRPGVVTIFNDDGSSAKYFVSSGSVTVNTDSSVQLLAEEAVPLDQLDITLFCKSARKTAELGDTGCTRLLHQCKKIGCQGQPGEGPV
uniref:ATP synthase F(1) complex subunit delta, mitochondrial n=1 Tax=Monopterus albus TaxID=43700 RepID=A0A3Q3KAK9_MONAL|nr:ATP synthase subunit delta, mitochondrial isoform X2 [Monopterus albus]